MSNPTTAFRATSDVKPQDAQRILDEARKDFRRATAELDAARDRLLTTYRDVQPIIDRATASARSHTGRG